MGASSSVRHRVRLWGWTHGRRGRSRSSLCVGRALGTEGAALRGTAARVRAGGVTARLGRAGRRGGLAYHSLGRFANTRDLFVVTICAVPNSVSGRGSAWDQGRADREGGRTVRRGRDGAPAEPCGSGRRRARRGLRGWQHAGPGPAQGQTSQAAPVVGEGTLAQALAEPGGTHPPRAQPQPQPQPLTPGCGDSAVPDPATQSQVVARDPVCRPSQGARSGPELPPPPGLLWCWDSPRPLPTPETHREGLARPLRGGGSPPGPSS